MKPSRRGASIGWREGRTVSNPVRRGNEVRKPPFPIASVLSGAGTLGRWNFGALGRSDAMKHMSTAAAILLLSGGFALAQGVGGATGPVGSGTTGPTNPGSPPSPGITPVPPGGATVGQAPGGGPGNPQDLTNRGNPQDLTRPGAANPQDLKR
jgi:hypothetical protein